MSDEVERNAARLAELLEAARLCVAVSESLTAGQLCAALGAAPNSGTWFRGGVVAYATEVKRGVLGVPDSPPVSAETAAAMAEGVRELMRADLAVATTGVGGPEPQDGEPVGSVWLAVSTPDGVDTHHYSFSGDPEQVLRQTVEHALELLRAAVPAPSRTTGRTHP
ncbi:CinA family protein [Nocardia sp. CDC159]|uniref:CinA family protein n=1 Tax=Nocardia pulmonis TaxID=2951408 RepID=A0A9X2E1Q8_9NOCA|nr:CinA family protein [Nocardia pulmonis]MCM6785362.1 CinA family protein [Nocardia sp. CDC159]